MGGCVDEAAILGIGSRGAVACRDSGKCTEGVCCIDSSGENAGGAGDESDAADGRVVALMIATGGRGGDGGGGKGDKADCDTLYGDSCEEAENTDWAFPLRAAINSATLE